MIANLQSGPDDGAQTPGEAPALLRGPHNVGALRLAMLGFLFFFPLLSVYLDVVGWLLLLLSAHRLGGPSWRGRRLLLLTAWCGLAVAGSRIAAVAVGFLAADTLLFAPSPLLAAVFLWQVSDLIVRAAQSVGDRALPGQARTRRVLYAAQALIPLLAPAIRSSVRTQAGELLIMTAYLTAGVFITTLAMALLANAATMCRAAMAADAGRGPTAA